MLAKKIEERIGKIDNSCVCGPSKDWCDYVRNEGMDPIRYL